MVGNRFENQAQKIGGSARYGRGQSATGSRSLSVARSEATGEGDQAVVYPRHILAISFQVEGGQKLLTVSCGAKADDHHLKGASVEPHGLTQADALRFGLGQGVPSIQALPVG